MIPEYNKLDQHYEKPVYGSSLKMHTAGIAPIASESPVIGMGQIDYSDHQPSLQDQHLSGLHLHFKALLAATSGTLVLIAIGTLAFNSINAKINSIATGEKGQISASRLLDYKATALTDNIVSNSNLQAGSFESITGVGELAVGSIAPGFGSIDTTNNITTSANIQGGIGVFTGVHTENLDAAGINTGSITFEGSHGTVNLVANPTTKNQTLNLPNGTGTLCLQGSASCGFATSTSSGSNNYIQNQNALEQPNSNFWISGTARAGAALLSPTLDTASAVALNIGNTNATSINLGNSVSNITTTINGTLAVNGSSTFISQGTDAVIGAAVVDTANSINDFPTGWWTATGWTTSANGATHVTGNVSPLVSTWVPTIGITYQVSYAYDFCTSAVDTISVSMGGVTLQNADDCVGANTQIMTATSAAPLNFTPNSTYIGVVNDVVITPMTTQATSVINVMNSNSTFGLEVRSSSDANSIFIGLNSGRNNTVGGNGNTAIGSFSLQSNTTGAGNTALGSSAMNSNTTGNSNTANGDQALLSDTTGSFNTGIGGGALTLVTTGGYNVALGALSGNILTTGSYNTLLGYNAGFNLTTGSNNVIIGQNAQAISTDGNDQLQVGAGISGDLALGTLAIKTITDSTVAFKVQNAASMALFTADTSGMVITVAGTDTSYASLTLTDTHFKSTQTTAPTIGTPANCGTSPSAVVTTGSTDTAGSFSITVGTGGASTTCDTVLTFNKPYAVAPKSIIIAFTQAVGGANIPLWFASISASSTTGFTVKEASMDLTGLNHVAGDISSYYYWVVE